MPRRDLLLALCTFNVGVEVGQVAFVVLMVRLEQSFQQLEIRWPRWVEMVPGYVVGALVVADRKLPLPVVIGGAVLLGLAQSGALGMVETASALFAVVVLQAAWARVSERTSTKQTCMKCAPSLLFAGRMKAHGCPEETNMHHTWAIHR